MPPSASECSRRVFLGIGLAAAAPAARDSSAQSLDLRAIRVARGGAFLVSAAIQNGSIDMVDLESQAGAECRLRNPWGSGAVTLRREGGRAESLSGALLRFPTRKGERVRVTPA